MIPVLKDCPFCGDEATYFWEDDRHTIYCENCLVVMDSPELDDVVQRWNARVASQETE